MKLLLCIAALATAPVSNTERALRHLGGDTPTVTEIASAIDKAATLREERLMLAAVAWHESEYKSDVAHCQKTGDGGKAVGVWQSWNLKCPVTVDQQAKEAIRHLRRARNYCGGDTQKARVMGAVSLYATGKTCRWEGAEARWRTFLNLGRFM